MHLCRYLRWKGYAHDATELAEFELTFARNQVPYSCLHTCQPWGPDDDLAAPERCDDSRPCYEASPLLQLRLS